MPSLLPIPILTYHQIDEAPQKGTPMRSLYVSANSFKRQMAILKRLGYLGLSMSQLMPYIRGEKTGRVVGITFDDGFLNNLQTAAPILNSVGFTSTCYAVSALAGTTNTWDKELGVPSAELMSVQHLREWIAAGQEIGSHTLTHRDLTQLDSAAALVEIAKSKTDLEQSLGVPISQFCYHYGSYDPVHIQMVREAGYAGATTTVRGRVQPNQLTQAGDAAHTGNESSLLSLFELPRVPVVRSTSWLQFLLKIGTAYEDNRSK